MHWYAVIRLYALSSIISYTDQFSHSQIVDEALSEGYQLLEQGFILTDHAKVSFEFLNEFLGDA